MNPATRTLLALGIAAGAGFARPADSGGPWFKAGRVDTNTVTLAGNWMSDGVALTGQAGASASFRVEPARRFYLKLRMDLKGEAVFYLNQEAIRLGPGLRVEPAGGLNWAALPDRTPPATEGDRHTLELICQDGCLDVLWDNASAGFGQWPADRGLSNGVFRVEQGAATWLSLEWRGPQAFANPAPPAPPRPARPNPVEPPPEEAPAVPLTAATAPSPPRAPAPMESPPPPAPTGTPPAIPAPSPSRVATLPPEGPARTLALLRGRLKKPAGVTWVFAGDSITLGGHFTGGGRSYPEHFQERIRWEMKRFDDAVINTAFNGATTDRLAAVLDERVLRHHPDVVFLMIGSNDARRGEAWLPRFRDWLELLVQRLRQGGALVILQTANHPVSNRDPALLRNDTLYMQEVRDTARRLDAPLIDHWNLWEAFHADHEGRYDWMGDAIHPNARGHLRMALDIFRALNLYDTGSKVVQLEEGEKEHRD